MSSPPIRFSVAVLAIAALASGCGPVVPHRATSGTHSQVVQATPASLDHAKGRVVLVDFWATYCDPCKRAFPAVQALSDRFGDDLAVVAVSVDEPGVGAEALTEFADEARVHFPLFWDTDRAMQRRFAPKSLPTTYVLDRTGAVRFVHRDFEAGDEEKLEREIGMLIADRAD